MLKKLRELDDDTVIADGRKFDLAKVSETALGILRALLGRAMIRFPNSEPPEFMFAFDDEARAFDEDSYAQITYAFDECKLTRFDVTMFSCEVRFGPFMTDLYLLGFDCLHGTVKNCLTDRDLNWDELDPTPVMMVMMRRGMVDPFDELHYDFLIQTLNGFLSHGITWDLYDSETDDLAIMVRFPHEAFGKGEGPMRICRYLRDSKRYEQGDS